MSHDAAAPALQKVLAHWPLWAALMLGCLAAWMGARYLESRIRESEGELARRFELRPVIVAARALVAGHVLGEADLASRRVPARFAPSAVQDIGTASTLVGRRLSDALAAGDPVLPSVLEDESQRELSGVLAPGTRAITFPVDPTMSFAGLLAPGDVIDLVHVDEGATGSSGPKVRSLLEGVRVVATGHRMQSGTGTGEPFDTVTVDVSPRDAQRLVLAQQSGTLAALLRASGDREAPRLAPLGMEALFGAPPATGRRPLRRTVEFIIGGTGRRQESGA